MGMVESAFVTLMFNSSRTLSISDWSMSGAPFITTFLCLSDGFEYVTKSVFSCSNSFISLSLSASVYTIILTWLNLTKNLLWPNIWVVSVANV